MSRVRADLTSDWPTVEVDGILDRWRLDEVEELLHPDADTLEELAIQAHAANDPDDIGISLRRGDLEEYVADRRARERTA